MLMPLLNFSPRYSVRHYEGCSHPAQEMKVSEGLISSSSMQALEWFKGVAESHRVDR